MRISDWSSDVCSSDLRQHAFERGLEGFGGRQRVLVQLHVAAIEFRMATIVRILRRRWDVVRAAPDLDLRFAVLGCGLGFVESLQRSEEHTSELQSLMRISYAVFCLKKNKNTVTSY